MTTADTRTVADDRADLLESVSGAMECLRRGEAIAESMLDIIGASKGAEGFMDAISADDYETARHAMRTASRLFGVMLEGLRRQVRHEGGAAPGNGRMAMTTIYHDTQDPNNHGWAWRTRAADGSEESGPVDDDRITRALDAMDAGDEPRPGDLAALRAEYPEAEFVDRNGYRVGRIFPGTVA